MTLEDGHIDSICGRSIMPWNEVTIVSERYEFVTMALAEGANMSALCRSFVINHFPAHRAWPNTPYGMKKSHAGTTC